MYNANLDSWEYMSSRNVPATPDPGVDVPATNPDNIPSVPLPPIVGTPEPNPDNIPVVPLPPTVGTPEANPDNIPVIPLPPIIGTPEVNPDVGPIYPDIPNPNYCTVRFLNSASSYSVCVRVGSALVTSGLSFGELTSYVLIPDGFRTVRITDESAPAVLYLQKSIPFRAGDIITLVIVRTAAGLDLVQVADTPCQNRPVNMSCIRMANMAYGAPGLDLILDGNKLVFTDVRYKENTLYKQARPRRYRFTIAGTINIPTPYDSDIETIDEMPRLLPAYILGLRPAISFTLNARAGLMYTIYIIGSWARPRIKIVVNQA